MRKKKNKKTVADTGYKKVDRKEKRKRKSRKKNAGRKNCLFKQSIAYKEMGRDGICRVQEKLILSASASMTSTTSWLRTKIKMRSLKLV